MNELTTKLNNGIEVLAKQTKYGITALTYANKTQAYKKLAVMDCYKWQVYHFSVPFYIGKVA